MVNGQCSMAQRSLSGTRTGAKADCKTDATPCWRRTISTISNIAGVSILWGKTNRKRTWRVFYDRGRLFFNNARLFVLKGRLLLWYEVLFLRLWNNRCFCSRSMWRLFKRLRSPTHTKWGFCWFLFQNNQFSVYLPLVFENLSQFFERHFFHKVAYFASKMP